MEPEDRQSFELFSSLEWQIISSFEMKDVKKASTDVFGPDFSMVTAERESGIFGLVLSLNHGAAIAVVPLRLLTYPAG